MTTTNSTVKKTLDALYNRTSNSVIVESGKSSTSWWRKWSDGFIEQGGKTANVTNSGLNISFAKSFSNTNYYVLATVTGSNSSDTGSYEYGLTVAYPTSKSSFKVYLRSYENNYVSKPIFWYANGY